MLTVGGGSSDSQLLLQFPKLSGRAGREQQPRAKLGHGWARKCENKRTGEPAMGGWAQGRASMNQHNGGHTGKAVLRRCEGGSENTALLKSRSLTQPCFLHPGHGGLVHTSISHTEPRPQACGTA